MLPNSTFKQHENKYELCKMLTETHTYKSDSEWQYLNKIKLYIDVPMLGPLSEESANISLAL